MTEFKLGDLVRHKSGGPIMVVHDPLAADGSCKHIECEWYSPAENIFVKCKIKSTSLEHFPNETKTIDEQIAIMNTDYRRTI